jgi:hypothetical protein
MLQLLFPENWVSVLHVFTPLGYENFTFAATIPPHLVDILGRYYSAMTHDVV